MELQQDFTKTKVSLPASPTHIGFAHGDNVYYFTIVRRLNDLDRFKNVYLGFFSREKNGGNPNKPLPAGLEFDTHYCLKQATVAFPLDQGIHPQDRHFWDFFPFVGDNLREVLALNNDALRLSDMLINGSLDPLNGQQTEIFSCAVIEPVYEPFNISDFKTPQEKIDCMLQIIAGLNQLMSNKTLNRFKIVAHRDLKFSNVVVETLPDNSKRLRIIDFPSIKTSLRDNDIAANHTQLGFLSYSNTAPEDVMRRFNISSKTDVFALGTMLAEIFEIWNYDGIHNPLTLLFKTMNNVITTDATECRKFYNDLDQMYPFTNHNVPNWLELALDAHEKNSSWANVERICPEIRTLFHAATVINPKHRITLRNFESKLKEIYKSLSKETVVPEDKPIFDDTKNITYFLIDTSELDRYRDIYIEAANQVISNSPDVNFAITQFGWSHLSARLSPNPAPLSLTPIGAEDVVGHILVINESYRGKMYASELKRCLYDLCGYLENKSNLDKFSGEIHIFAPEMPNESNTCCFQKYLTNTVGVIEPKVLTGADICKFFDKDTKIYVHSFEDNINLEHWYTAVPFKSERPIGNYSQLNINVDSSSSQDASVDDDSLIKGTGFHFIGGKSYN